MKSFLYAIVILFTSINVWSQTDCKPYMPAEKGTVWEVTNYNQKGKVTGRITYELVDKVVNGNEIIYTANTVYYDKKDKQIYDNTFEAKCVDGKFEFDMTYKMDGAALQSYGDMDVKVDATEFEIPSMDTPAGTQLEDGNLKVDIGDIGLNMSVLISNRIVGAQENITTPAGSFDCLVLSQDITTKVMINVRGSSKEWYAENVGMVRSESYNKKGKLIGYSELTKLEL